GPLPQRRERALEVPPFLVCSVERLDDRLDGSSASLRDHGQIRERLLDGAQSACQWFSRGTGDGLPEHRDRLVERLLDHGRPEDLGREELADPGVDLVEHGQARVPADGRAAAGVLPAAVPKQSAGRGRARDNLNSLPADATASESAQEIGTTAPADL